MSGNMTDSAPEVTAEAIVAAPDSQPMELGTQASVASAMPVSTPATAKAAPATPASRGQAVVRAEAIRLAMEAPCWYECGSTDVANIGNARSVRMCCRPCVCAKRALDKSVSGAGHEGAKAALAHMKANNQAEYKAKVRALRIVEGGQTGGQPGMVSLAARREAIGQFVQAAQTFVDVNHDMPILWPDHAEYLMYMVTVKGIGKDEAEASWQRDLADPDIQRCGQGAGLRVAVRGVPVTHGIRGKRVTRDVSATVGVSNAAELEVANKRLRGLAGQSADRTFAELAGEVFLPGHSSSAGGTSDLPSGPAVEGPGVSIKELQDTALTTSGADTGDDIPLGQLRELRAVAEEAMPAAGKTTARTPPPTHCLRYALVNVRETYSDRHHHHIPPMLCGQCWLVEAFLAPSSQHHCCPVEEAARCRSHIVVAWHIAC